MLPETLKYLRVDGYYTKKQFLDPICALERGLEVLGKLRCDVTSSTCIRVMRQALADPNVVTLKLTLVT